MFAPTKSAVAVAAVSLVAATGLMFGSTPASAELSPTPQRCERAGKLLAKADGKKDKLAQLYTTRHDKLEAALNKAQSSNHPKIADRITKRLDRLEAGKTRLTGRYDKLQAFVASCPAN